MLKLSVSISLIGLIILSGISQSVEFELSNINQLTINDIDNTIKLKGIITKVKEADKVTFFDVAQHSKMPVIIFGTNISINEGDEVEILGKVAKYNGNIELIADRIEKV